MKAASDKKIIVIYDGGCTDGFGGAWAAWKKFGASAFYHGGSHTEVPMTHLHGKKIYFIDFCYDAPVIRKLLRNGNHIVSLEHHESHEEAVKMAHEYRYDTEHSGCVLAWQYFFPKKPVPRLLRHIEDIDLWKFRLPHTKAARAFLETQDMDFRTWSGLIKDFENPAKRKKLIEKGETVLAYQDKLCEELIRESAERVRFKGIVTYAVNAPNYNSHNLTDMIGDKLLRAHPPMAIVWKQRRKTIKVSLRSNGGVNVAQLASQFGGGGHRDSSGFSIPRDSKLPWTVLSEEDK
ncbi:MAG TPA: DHHA1 domain-containing protein [Candidatus Paceibacterota bacterium]|nr:DHHA1 domain-containing protein [Candidatus Paceibacterota bacterium]